MYGAQDKSQVDEAFFALTRDIKTRLGENSGPSRNAGTVQVIIWRALRERFQQALLGARLLAVRGVWQLRRLTLRYCEHGGSSRGVRALLDSPAVAAIIQVSKEQLPKELAQLKPPLLEMLKLLADDKVWWCRMAMCVSVCSYQGDAAASVTISELYQ